MPDSAPEWTDQEGGTPMSAEPSPDPVRLADLVRQAARSAGERVAFIDGARRLTWNELDAEVDRVAGALAGLGWGAGARVCLVLGNTLAFPVAYFGVLRAGLVAVPLNPGYTAQELRWTLSDSGARAVVVSAAGRDLLLEVAGEVPSLEHVLVTGPAGAATSWHDLLEGAAGQSSPTAGAGEDLAVLLYTSGTSGRPKGAMLPHRALLANLDQTSRIEPPVMAAEVVGSVSERGLLSELFGHRVRPADAVAGVMEESLPMLGATESVADAVALLRSCDALLVLDDGKPVGVLTRQDLLSDINIR